MRKACLALLLAGLLAGCLQSAPDGDGPWPGGALDGSLVAFAACINSCFEPTIAVAPAGTVYVTAASDHVWRGDPVGDTYAWTNVTPPAGPGFFPADRIVDVSPTGRVFVSELSYGSGGAASVRLVASDDNGTTWPVEHTFANAVLGQSMDRQWVAFGGGGRVVLVYKNQAEGLYAHWSDDDGDTFDGGTLVSFQGGTPGGVGPASAAMSIIAGAPAIDGSRALVPLFHPGYVLGSTPVQAGGLSVVAIEPGRPPVESPVLVDGVQARGNFFPRLLWREQVLWMAWKDYDGKLHVGYGGPPFELVAVAPPQHGLLTASPWMAVGADGRLHLAWTEGEAGTSRMRHAVQAGGGWAVTDVGPTFGDEARPGHTDFAHFGLHGGRALFPMARADAGVEVVRVPAAAG